MKRNEEEELNEQKAEEMLQNVFRAAGVKPNTTPLPELLSKREARIRGLVNARILALCLLALVLISPIAFRESLLDDFGRPVVTDDLLIGNNLTLFLRDSGAGIDYEGIHAETGEGEKILPKGFSEKTKSVSFEVTDSDLKITIPSKTGLAAHILFSRERSEIQSERSVLDMFQPATPKK